MGMHRIVAGFICMFASLAYLTMATGHGYIVRCCIPILTSLCRWDRTAQSLTTGNLDGQLENFGVFKACRLRRYRTAMNITVVTWFFYPIVWIFAEGTGDMSAYAEAICYTALDVIAKSVFGFVLVQNLGPDDFDDEE